MFCLGCGNKIPEGKECPVCGTGPAVRRPARAPAPPRKESPRKEALASKETTDTTQFRSRGQEAPRHADTHLCRGCGNDVPEGEDCPVCAATRARKEAQAAKEAADTTQFCRSCGNEVPAGRPCPVCEESRTRHKDVKPSAAFCPRCGNTVEDPQHCPICSSGHGPPRAAAPPAVPACPRCTDPLEPQDWDGIAVLLCPTCQGSLFPPGGLEKTLDKLREAKEETDLSEVLNEFKDRHQRKLASAVRYKNCPTCAVLMTRRNYIGSGIIVDVCGQHGTWVDQAAFGDLAAFISRGGDVLAARNPLRRKR